MGQFSGHVAVVPAEELSYLAGHYDFLYTMIDADIAVWLQRNDLRVTSPELVKSALEADGGKIRAGLNSKNSDEVSQAIADLVWKIRDTENVDLVIIPQVLANSRMLQRPYSGATWDGVQRDFKVNGSPEAGSQLQADTATLTVGVYNRLGQPEYFGRGGLDFLDNGTRVGEGIVTSPKQPGQVAPADVQEAVNLSLNPWAAAIRTAIGQSSF